MPAVPAVARDVEPRHAVPAHVAERHRLVIDPLCHVAKYSRGSATEGSTPTKVAGPQPREAAKTGWQILTNGPPSGSCLLLADAAIAPQKSVRVLDPKRTFALCLPPCWFPQGTGNLLE